MIDVARMTYTTGDQGAVDKLERWVCACLGALVLLSESQSEQLLFPPGNVQPYNGQRSQWATNANWYDTVNTPACWVSKYVDEKVVVQGGNDLSRHSPLEVMLAIRSEQPYMVRRGVSTRNLGRGVDYYVSRIIQRLHYAMPLDPDHPAFNPTSSEADMLKAGVTRICFQNNGDWFQRLQLTEVKPEVEDAPASSNLMIVDIYFNTERLLPNYPH